MKKLFFVATLLLLSSVLFAAPAINGQGQVNFSIGGAIGFDSFTLIIQEANAEDSRSTSIDAVSFEDISAINTAGFIVSEKTYEIKYSYFAQSAQTFVLDVSIAEGGLVTLGETEPKISIEFLDIETDFTTPVTWDTLTLQGLKNGVYKEFKIRLTNLTGEKLPAGDYYANVVFDVTFQ